MKKKDCRRYYKEMRNQLSARQINMMDDLMLIQFQQLPVPVPSAVMTYAPIQKWNEFNPQPVTDYCYFKNPGQQLLYPLMAELDSRFEMVAMLVDDNTVFEPNAYGIDEPVNGRDVAPSSIDMVIVPLLCFDKKGFRVGYGKGYYDRFLKNCRPDCIRIGFSYFDPLESIEDVNEQDVRLDYCCTHDRIYQF